MPSQYGELRPTSSWDLLASLGHPCKFQRVLCLGSVTARHYSSGCQPNSTALNRGRRLYLAGRPSHWTLAHISSSFLYGHDTQEWEFLGLLAHERHLAVGLHPSPLEWCPQWYSHVDLLVYDLRTVLFTRCKSFCWLLWLFISTCSRRCH